MPKKTTKPRVSKATSGARQTAEYRHKEETPARPDVGVQPQFKKRAAAERWVRAVNADASFGNWRYAVAKQISEVPKLLSTAAAG